MKNFLKISALIGVVIFSSSTAFAESGSSYPTVSFNSAFNGEISALLLEAGQVLFSELSITLEQSRLDLIEEMKSSAELALEKLKPSASKEIQGVEYPSDSAPASAEPNFTYSS